MSFSFRFALAVLLAAASLSGQTPQATPERAIDWGFEQRVRNENWDNIMDFNDGMADLRNQIRYRTRLWMNAPVSSNIDLFVGLNQETNQIIRTHTPWRMDEGIIENAYIDFKKVFIKGLSLRVGRQNLIRGEGFLMLEGDCYDGSRSIYMNAANLAYSWKKSKLELIGILDPKRDRFLPRINNRNRLLTEWDEQALGAYYTDKNLKRTSVEAYYFYKKEVNDYRAPSNPQFQPDRHISTAGGRVVQSLDKSWSLAGEFAAQWGRQHPNTAITGWGGYGYLKRQSTSRMKPYVQLGWWGMSGDNPQTKDKIEGWDPIFGRWPKWSELYIYSQFREKGVAYWTNTSMWQGEYGFAPTKAVGIRATYYHMDSFQPFAGNTAIFGSGTRRGDMYQARVDLKANQNWSGHVLWEHMLPGDFYSAKAPGYFLRFEVIYLLKGKLGI